MSLWQRLVQQPQRILLRRALFQVHLWTGIAVGLYILIISVSGSFVVFRNEAVRYFTPAATILEGQGELLTDEQLTMIAETAHPGFKVTDVFRGRRKEQAVEIWMDSDSGDKRQRSFHPFTGEDLGDSIPAGLRLMNWMIDLHDNLLAGDTGRFWNGIGGIFLTLLCLTGLLIWWPGIKTWKQSLMIRRKVGWKRFNWDLHSALGFWFLLLVLLWGVSGIYLSIPDPFNAVVDYLEPWEEIEGNEPRIGDEVLLWFGRLHFGRYYGIPMKVAWTILGMVPAVLFVTGGVMWWNRVVNPWRRRENRAVEVGVRN